MNTLLCLLFLLAIAISVTHGLAAPQVEGPICFQCSKLQDPYSCNVTTRCAATEKCFSSYYFYGDPIDALVWDVGCKAQSFCHNVQQRSSISLRRSLERGRAVHVDSTQFRTHRRQWTVKDLNQNDDNDNRFTVCNECCEQTYCNELPCEHDQSPEKAPTGLVCHSCQNADDISKCFEVKRCHHDEMCASWISSNGRLNMGCKTISQCPNGLTSVSATNRVPRDVNTIGFKFSVGPQDESSRYREINNGTDKFSFQHLAPGSDRKTRTQPTKLILNDGQGESKYTFTRSMRSVACNECCNASYCAFSLCPFVSNIDTPITVALTPENVTTLEGNNATFVCDIAGTGPLDVSFYLAATNASNSSFEIISCKTLFNTTDVRKNTTCVLKDVSLPYSGTVTCLVKSASRLSIATANLTVQPRRQPFKGISRPPDTVVLAPNGSATSVACKVEGYPPPQYAWYQNSSSGSLVDVQSLPLFNFSISMTSDGTSVLRFNSSFSKSNTIDENFICQASNRYETMTLPFVMKSATQITPVGRPVSVHVGVKNNASLLSFSCAFSGFPIANVSWILKQDILNLGHRPLVNITSTTNGLVVKSHIVIPADIFRQVNATRIQCMADNGYFSSGEFAEVHFLTAPIIVSPAPSTSLHLKSGSTLLLTCKAEGIPDPRISWTFTDKYGNPSIIAGVKILDSGKTLSVAEMKMEGTLICFAANSQGRDQVAVTINIDSS